MGFFDKLKDVPASVTDRFNVTTNTMKLNNQIKTNDSEIEKVIYQIGRRALDLHFQDPDSEYADLFQQYAALNEQNDSLREDIERCKQEQEAAEQERQREREEREARREAERRQQEMMKQQQYPYQAPQQRGYMGGNPNMGGAPNMGSNPNMGGAPNMGSNPNMGGNPNMGNPYMNGQPYMGGAQNQNLGNRPTAMPGPGEVVCSKCGGVNAAEDTFCIHCGNALPQAPQYIRPFGNAPQAPQNSQQVEETSQAAAEAFRPEEPVPTTEQQPEGEETLHIHPPVQPSEEILDGEGEAVVSPEDQVHES